MTMEVKKRKKASVALWLILWLLILGILLQGHFAFKVVGDAGPTNWDYGIVKDVPGQSPYAIYELLPDSQHIQGKKGE
jgi:hypothetical protein